MGKEMLERGQDNEGIEERDGKIRDAVKMKGR